MTHATSPQPGGQGPGKDVASSKSKVSYRKVIRVGNRDLSVVTSEALTVLHRVNDEEPFVFLHGVSPVRLRTDGEHPRLEPLVEKNLRQVMAKIAAWVQPVKGDEERTKPVAPPLTVMANMLATPGWRVPQIERIVDVPVFGPDGSFETTPGYHPGSRTVLVPSPGLFVPTVSVAPTTAEVAFAVALLAEDLLGDFPFVADSDRAHAIAALLLPFVRAMIGGVTPGHLVSAPVRGTGKTLLARLVAFPAVGRTVAAQTEARNEDEWRKKITASVSTGPAVILFDNLLHFLGAAALAAALTAPEIEDRRLGKNDEMIRYPNRALWLFAANNLDLSDEMVRRMVPIRLDAQEERPYDRDVGQFRHPDIEAWASENRGLLVWAAGTIVRAWIAAGSPPGTRMLGSFEPWARVMGGILDVAGIPGFLADIDDFRDGFDADTAGWVDLFDMWFEAWGSQAIGAKQVLDMYRQGDDFLNIGVWGDDSAKPEETRLGFRLKKRQDAIYGGLRLEYVGKERGGNRWRLVEVTG